MVDVTRHVIHVAYTLLLARQPNLNPPEVFKGCAVVPRVLLRATSPKRLPRQRANRLSQAFNERVLVERLAQEADRSIVKRTLPVVFVRISGNQNDRRLVSLRPQCFL